MKKVRHKNQTPFNLKTKPLLIVLSGPSGVGKDAVLNRLRESQSPFEYVTTVTTRPKRTTERDKIDYHFISLSKFHEMLENTELLEWANVYGHWYGVPKQPVKQALDKGRDVMLKVDIQGVANIKRILPQAIFIFMAPPSAEELTIRLQLRHTETSPDLALRIKTAKEEMKQVSLFDYLVINKQDKINQTVTNIEAIINAEKCRVKPRKITF
ncbi:guanylate kinase [Chloroflexota bacterium]